MIVRTTVKSIQDIMRQDVGVDGDVQRISQLCWMFFLKIIDDQDQELELTKDGYRSPIPKQHRWRSFLHAALRERNNRRKPYKRTGRHPARENNFLHRAISIAAGNGLARRILRQTTPFHPHPRAGGVAIQADRSSSVRASSTTCTSPMPFEEMRLTHLIDQAA